MLKTNNIQIEKIKLESTNINVALEDSEVQPEQYYFLKDRLTTYKFYINSAYSLKSKIEYDELSKLLLIGINIIIPDHYIPNDTKKANEILMEPINTFQLFYDAQNKIYEKKHLKYINGHQIGIVK
ncbi:MAG: hypothetical protein WCF28_11475 [Methanobacterium sp.]|uniref:hypothetical protein n=1 Tax=Methanobacterium sp. TaxID=2164 RepID=UPI003C77A23B